MGNELEVNTQLQKTQSLDSTQANKRHETTRSNATNNESTQMCQDLMKMGFAEDISREVAQIFPDNLNDAMDLIINKEAIDKIVNEQIDEDNQNNDSKSEQGLTDPHNVQNQQEDIHRHSIVDYDADYNNNNGDHHADPDDNSNHVSISETLQTADIVIKGEYNPYTSSESMLHLCDLIRHALSQDTVSPHTMTKPFVSWSNEVKAVHLNSFYYEDICRCLLMKHKRVQNLYAFDKINELFLNVEVIETFHTGWISLYYLEALLQILDNIHYLEYTKLHKIHLHDINNMGSISS
eukprot:469930_1